MKFSKILTASAAMALGLASCTSDAPELSTRNDGNVNFSVRLASATTSRAAFSDGLQAELLDYAVYSTDGTLVLSEQAKFNNSLETNVTINLVNGVAYKIAFFAHNDTKAYTFDAENGKFTVNYDVMAQDYNVTDYDSFFELVEIPAVTGALNQDVTLTRPVARINWGTNDLNSKAVVSETAYGADAANLTSKVVLKDVYTTYDMLANKVTDDVTDVEFSAVARPMTTDGGLTVPAFPIEDYDYVSMQYILVPSTQAVVDAEWIPYCNDNEMPSVPVTSMPVQANYNTNIYGALLTSPANFKVVKNQIFDEPDYDILLWSGEVDTELPVDAEDSYQITISTAAQLAGLAARVNNGESFRNYTIKLANDIDLNNVLWTPIGKLAPAPYSGFAGIFDGDGHTIYNLYTEAPEPYKVGEESAGLFGSAVLQVGNVPHAEIKNLTVDGATVKSGHYAGAIVGHTNSGVDIINCHVKNSTIVSTYKNEDDSGDKAGGIVGYFYGGVMENCSVDNTTVTAARDLGGLVGMLQIDSNDSNSTVTVKNCSATNTEVYATSYTENIGEIAGRRASITARVIEEGNTYSNVNLHVYLADGLEILNGIYSVSTATGMVKLSDMHAENYNIFSGKTIKMTADIDMTGVEFTPFGPTVSNYPTGAFRGTFDGNGKTISNLTVSCNTTEYAAAGLFGTIVGGSTVIKDLTVKNPSIKSTHYAGGIAGYCSNNTGTVIQNCKVIGGTITSSAEEKSTGWDNGDKVGGIIGFCDNGDYVKDCTVEDVTITGYRHVGSIVGYTNNLGCFTGNIAKNVTIKWDSSQDYKGFLEKAPTSTIFGPIAGCTLELGDNTAENVVYPTFSEE